MAAGRAGARKEGSAQCKRCRPCLLVCPPASRIFITHPSTCPTPTPCPPPPQASKAFTDSKEELLLLWAHEALRVLGDRMWDPADRQWLLRQLDGQLGSQFGTSLAELAEPYGGEVGGEGTARGFCVGH